MIGRLYLYLLHQADIYETRKVSTYAAYHTYIVIRIIIFFKILDLTGVNAAIFWNNHHICRVTTTPRIMLKAQLPLGGVTMMKAAHFSSSCGRHRLLVCDAHARH